MNSSKEIQQAKQLLKDNGFYIENLWHVDDAKYGANSEDKYIECTNDEAYKVLSEAIQQESINECIFDNIQAINEAKFRTMDTIQFFSTAKELKQAIRTGFNYPKPKFTETNIHSINGYLFSKNSPPDITNTAVKSYSIDLGTILISEPYFVTLK
tara:strand:+ start:675 stop:1139 length:465 start_codon:yes stop_codon:yes gene_type:complete